MVIIAPEKPLVDGFVEYLNRFYIVLVPIMVVALIEGSKVFSKHFMSTNNIVTSNYQKYDNYQHAIIYISTIDITNYVIKDYGFALGKGSIYQIISITRETIFRRYILITPWKINYYRRLIDW